MPTPQFIRDIRSKLGNDLLLLPSVAALTFNAQGEVLLVRRADTGRWATTDGIIEPGEEPAAAAIREVMEETGLEISIDRLSGVYMSPRIKYPNGDHAQFIVTAFRCRVLGGEAKVNDDESLEVQFFPLNKLPDDLRPDQELRILHASDPTDERAFYFQE